MTETAIDVRPVLDMRLNMHAAELPDDIFTQQREARRELIRLAKRHCIETTRTRRLASRCGRDTRQIRRTAGHAVQANSDSYPRDIAFSAHRKAHATCTAYLGILRRQIRERGEHLQAFVGKMPIYQQTGTDGRDIVKYHTILDFNTYTGKPLSTVRCKTGESLIDFHHGLVTKIARLNTETQCVDATEWFEGAGGHAQNYYEQFLTLFIRDSILFEYFEPGKAEETFALEVMLPAFRHVTERYGVRPLIARLVPKSKEARKFWDCYPKKIEKFLTL